jgi:hypothetical protein
MYSNLGLTVLSYCQSGKFLVYTTFDRAVHYSECPAPWVMQSDIKCVDLALSVECGIRSPPSKHVFLNGDNVILFRHSYTRICTCVFPAL